ncbi:MAG: Flp1 family type IVb pilin [Bacillota bacterium]
MGNMIIEFFKDEDGMQTVEMVIILVVLVGIAIVFRDQLIKWFNSLLGQAQQSDPTTLKEKIIEAK